MERSVFFVLTSKNTLLRLLTTIVAGLFLLQSAMASISLANPHAGQATGELCATLQPAPGEAGMPAYPGVPATHHGFCCILHAANIYFPPKISHAHLIRLQFPQELAELWASEDGIRDRREPSSAPQSPRAPPHRI
jgi:hypothetical protein